MTLQLVCCEGLMDTEQLAFSYFTSERPADFRRLVLAAIVSELDGGTTLSVPQLTRKLTRSYALDAESVADGVNALRSSIAFDALDMWNGARAQLLRLRGSDRLTAWAQRNSELLASVRQQATAA